MKYHSFWLGIITKTPYHFMKTVKNIKVMNLLPAFLFTKKKLIETESRLVVARSRQWGLEGNGSMSKKVETYQLQRK